jgi:hypothetical protein
MRVKATYFSPRQLTAFEAASIGMQWQFADVVSFRGVKEKPFVDTGLQVLGNSGTTFRGVLSADHGDLQDKLLEG